jgi:ParB family chromosome partitioning protein
MSDKAKRRPLGRGLSALFGESDAEPPPGDIAGRRLVPIELIRPSALQPRRHFAEDELEALAQSIRDKGILQPVLVRPVDDQAVSYELVAGERRWRAAQRVGLHEVPVIVRVLADSEAFEIALVENVQREDLSPLEEAAAYDRLIREFGRTQASLAAAVGKSRSHVANTVRLLSLPPPIRRHLEEGALSAGHARALLGATDPEGLAAEIVRRGLNVRATEELVQRRTLPPKPRTPRSGEADRAALERELATRLGLRVTLETRRRGGALTLHYASLDQLDRILALLRAG